jgi:hypothetical protein
MQLLDERRYRQLRAGITVADVLNYLIHHPEVVEEWWLYSGDKRTAGGWYFDKDGDEWIVGTLWWDDVLPRHFGTAAEACARFVLNELDFMSNRPKA